MFEKLERLPADPILGLMAAYRDDPNPHKIDLGVGVYKDEQGNTPVLTSVKRAEEIILADENTKAYLPPTGSPDFTQAIQKLLFGENHPAFTAKRIATIQSPGGCGALRLGADFALRCNPEATVWVSDPTWANHIPLLGNAGLKLAKYPYYDSATHALKFDEMVSTLRQVKRGDLVLLHGCCHNPCGADLTKAQWQTLSEMAEQQGFVPYIDIAYQGFGKGLVEDAYGVRLMAERLPEVIVASSCSKNFGIYRERVGALSIVTDSPESAITSTTQAASIARGMYSMPPSHGAAAVSLVLNMPELHQQWQVELTDMRDRINAMRELLVEKLTMKNASQDFSFIQNQLGMFSFLGITTEQVHQLREQYSIYMVDSSRISIAGMNHTNIDYLTDSIIKIL
ncbi:MAG: aspartate/tyrosine/aromatic aminotransferase [Pseudomonadales bacterium]|nr:aspartate/tyrosine/aromatic aminotransferase [Pseudomonadales bacterium]